ncbi:BTAD domain-containing putative transcriptional regulator [Sinosporangium siamense]|uniref:SARP family transcriptional regulator n=1 Tax=Sinosporangium siamense TaxID=1367973 RepID=A0A919RL75_9ACTN|nr:BTAD domain-containing putative transcriptional regulator [Sinosporangium siamense]GII95633.1 SARP family transcriptional regulator [Sinosporangium siamense]
MRFGVLGSTEVWRAAGQPVRVTGARLRALLVMLLLDAGRVVPVDRLIDGLYGDAPPARAGNALQSQVSRLRALLGDECALELSPAGYRLAADPDAVDAHRFARLFAEGRAALADGENRRAAELLNEALGLWRGQALADVLDAPFAEAESARLAESALAAHEERIEAELRLAESAGGGPARGATAEEIRSLVGAHPLRERLRGQLMRALVLAGRGAEALAAYEDTRRTLAEELGASPSPELSAVHLAVLRGEQARPAPAVRGLRAQLTSFVGRAAEVREVRRLLREQRLITLIGPGGAGKTRLAVEVAAGLTGQEVCFVELAPLTSGADLPQAMLAAIAGGQGELVARGDSAARLLAQLRGRTMVVVLDNCEHVVHDAAVLVDDVLAANPSVRVLASSREQLGITGEVLVPVPPLALPPPGALPEEPTAYAAVALFQDRAAAVRPGFTVTAGNVADVVRICRTLDGLPLAIELAAARTRSLPVEVIAAKLDDRFRLLTGGSRTALPRHRTLHAAVAWSWDLLEGEEQALARRLSVFAGDATLDDMERVCGGDVVGPLMALVEKSLVLEVSGRYRMLETIRAFCREQLAASGEEAGLRRAHALCFLDLAEEAEPYLRGAEQVVWLGRLIEAHDDMGVALRWAIEVGDAEIALRLAAALTWYWWLRGLRAESGALIRQVMTLVDYRPPKGLEAPYAYCVLKLILSTPPDDDLRAILAETMRLVDSLDLVGRHPLLVALKPLHAFVAQNYDKIAPAILRVTTHSDPWVRAWGHQLLGYLRLMTAQIDQAEEELTRSLEDFRRLGDRWGMAQAMLPLSQLSGYRGDHAAAMAATAEALDLVSVLDAPEETAYLLVRRGNERFRVGDPAGAAADYERAIEVNRRVGAAEVDVLALCGLADTQRVRGDLVKARETAEEAIRKCHIPLGGEEARSLAHITIGRVAEAEGDVHKALAHYRDAHRFAVIMMDLPVMADIAEALASVAVAIRDPGRAATLLGSTRVLRGVASVGDPDRDRTVTAARAALGDEAFDRAREAGAALDQEEALTLLDRCLAVEDGQGGLGR